ncbi:O-methyltransferase [Catelliglobosispora koreensis]|uniref:O-methyltransferase n=1 Tax=Catelliglobosispora koreensis TaxID=129052 RepID=UPI0003780E2C|nr:O-methyltransferase [Catelliglobosispora koreensis]
MANTQLWSKVDGYITDNLLGHDPVLEEALKASDAAGLPQIAVSAPLGAMLHLLALGSSRILEVGTLGGYSTICLARALGDGGKLITLEYDPKHAEVAEANIARAGLADKVDIRVGAALDTLATMEGEEPFDLFFIDADKVNNPNYYAWALKHSKPGTKIIVDNVIRGGAIVDPSDTSEAVVGTRALFEAVGPQVKATAIQTVGSKSYDGFLLAIVQ